MKWYKLTFIAVIALAVNACSPKPKQADEQSNVKYFRNLQFSETPWDTEKGTHPLTAEEAQKVNNYKFTYNNNNQLVSVEYNRNGVLLNYSSMGAAKITYAYEGDKQIKRFFNEKGEATKNNGVSVFEYTLNTDGMRIALQFLDENSNPIENRNNIHNYVWTKTDDDMIRELRYNLTGDSTVMNQFCPFYELRFSYDNNGYVTRMANFDDDTLYNCTAENCGDNGVSYFQFKNNENGDLLDFSVYNTIGLLSNLYWGWAKRVNVVDANGYVIESTLFDQDNEFLRWKKYSCN